MTNTTAVLIYLPLCILTALGFVIACTQDRKHPFIHNFLFLAVMVFCWQLTALLYHMTGSSQVARVLYDLKIPFVSLSALALFLFTVRFYRVNQYVTRGLVLLLCLIPLLTTVIAVTSPLHTFLRQVLVVDTSQPIHTAINIRGVWFWVHTAYCYLLILMSTIIALCQHRSLPRVHRLASLFLLSGVLLASGTNLVMLFSLFDFSFDFTLIGMSIAMIFMFVAMDNSVHMEFLVLARHEIYNFMEESIFILDNEHTILDENQAATRWLRDMGVPGDVRNFGAVLYLLEEQGARITPSDEMDVEEGVDLYLNTGDSFRVYNVRERKICHHGKQLGYFVTFLNVTRNRMHIDRLEKTAGIDALTGMPNRHSYQRALQELDKPDNLPLAVILGDLNRLKEVNDTYGHHEGDRLLKLIGMTLEAACPSQGEVFRIGGDEFLILVPGCDNGQAQQLVTQIGLELEAITDHPFRPSIALGFSVKERQEQDLEALVRLADSNMYTTKRTDQQHSPMEPHLSKDGGQP